MPTPPHDPDVGVPLLLQSLVLPFVAGAIGSAATIPNLSGWFDALEKPAFSPPKAVFGPVWTTLYLLMGAAHYLVMKNEAEPATKRAATILFGAATGPERALEHPLFRAAWPAPASAGTSGNDQSC